jgi:hypothetical protein
MSILVHWITPKGDLVKAHASVLIKRAHAKCLLSSKLFVVIVAMLLLLLLPILFLVGNPSFVSSISYFVCSNASTDNLAPMFQGGICEWGRYNYYGFFYPDQGVEYSYLAVRDSDMKFNGHDSIRVDGQGIPNSIYNRPEIDHPWIVACPGDRIIYRCWIKTAASTIGNGAILGMDVYGPSGKLWEVHVHDPEYGLFQQPQIGHPIYVPYGRNWTLQTLDFLVPDTYFSETEDGVSVPPQQISGFIPFLGCSWNQGETASIWFADAEIFVSPS